MAQVIGSFAEIGGADIGISNGRQLEHIQCFPRMHVLLVRSISSHVNAMMSASLHVPEVMVQKDPETLRERGRAMLLMGLLTSPCLLFLPSEEISALVVSQGCPHTVMAQSIRDFRVPCKLDVSFRAIARWRSELVQDANAVLADAAGKGRE